MVSYNAFSNMSYNVRINTFSFYIIGEKFIYLRANLLIIIYIKARKTAFFG
jgi:hypothetical protein